MDKQEYFSADIVKVMAWIRNTCNILPALSESCKFKGFCSDLDSEDQHSSSYYLLVGNTSADVLADMDDHISSSSGMYAIKVSKLLPYPGVRSQRYYHFVGEEVTQS